MMASAAVAERIIIGIDIGFTCTGVAVGRPDKMKRGEDIKPTPIQNWPNSSSDNQEYLWSIENKVPTLISYRAADIRARSWGFGCLDEKILGPNTLVCQYFKFLINKEDLEELNSHKPENEKETMENVRKWYRDFLAKLYEHIIADLTGPRWEIDWDSTVVEYIFGLPTKWDGNDELVTEFKQIIAAAGFTSKKNSSVTIGLTEGVASAVYTAKRVNHEFVVGNILIVCDAGGATSDICMVEVKKIDNKTVELGMLEMPLCISAGSVQIEEDFATSFADKLDRLQREHPSLFTKPVADNAIQVVTEEFRIIKVDFGTAKVPPNLKFSIPGLPSARVEFTMNEIGELFDKRVKRITEEVDMMLNNLKNMQPGRKVSAFLLSGGLGSSKYVQTSLRNHLEHQRIPLLADEAPEPPLAVCKGLVFDRMQRLLHGTSVLTVRRCRASYGLLRKEIYNKSEHGNKYEKVFKCPIDGKTHVEGIHWFLKRGTMIREDEPISFACERTTSFKNPGCKWEDTIVKSKMPTDSLPEFLGKGDSEVVCTITSESQPETLIPKRKYIFGRRFLEGKYQMLVRVEQDKVRFETHVGREKVGEYETDQISWEYTEDNETHQAQ